MKESTSSPSAESAQAPSRQALPTREAAASRQWLVVAAILLVTFLVQIPVVLNADLGWILTLDEKILDGSRLGVDIFELNPPLSVFMYMPAAWLGRITGLPPEWIVIVMVLAEIAAALAVIDRAGASAGLDAWERRLTLYSFAFLLAILPGLVFGQREHIAVIALTPFVAITALRWRGLDPGRVALFAGVGAGLAMGIKPFFALIAGLPILCTAVRRRSLRPLFTPEMWTAAVIAIGYGAVIVIAFPAYLSRYAPMVAAAYLPIRRDLWALLPVPIVALGASLGFLRLLGPQNLRPGSAAIPWLAAACGGAASYLLQGKGWPYMAFALCLFAVAAPLLQVRRGTWRTPIAVGGLATVIAIGLFLSSPAPGFPPLAARVQAHAKHPRLLTITDHVGLGHPLVREIGGVWVGSSCMQLLSAGAILRLNGSQLAQDERARLAGIIDVERRNLLADIRNGRPDVILVDTLLLSSFPFDWLAWANADPELRQELSRYREVEDVGRVRIFVDRTAS